MLVGIVHNRVILLCAKNNPAKQEYTLPWYTEIYTQTPAHHTCIFRVMAITETGPCRSIEVQQSIHQRFSLPH